MNSDRTSCHKPTELGKPLNIGLAILLGLGLAVRIWYQMDRPFTGDEVGSLLEIRRGYSYLWSHFPHPSWLTMNYYLILLKAIASVTSHNHWALVLPSMLAGVSIIPLSALIARQLANSRTAFFTALFVAFNPYLIFYSVQIRSYMLFTAFVLASTNSFFRWSNSNRWSHGIHCAGFSLLATLAHPLAVFHLAFLWLLIWMLPSRVPAENNVPKDGGVRLSLMVPLIISTMLQFLAYSHLLKQMFNFYLVRSDVPSVRLNYAGTLFDLYFGAGLLSAASLAFIGLGLWECSQPNHRSMLLSLSALIPIVVFSLTGISHYPWAYARFLMYNLPYLLLFQALGIDSLVGKRKEFLAAFVAVLVLATWWPNAQAQFARKRDYPWHRAAAWLNGHLAPEDHLLTIEHGDIHSRLNLLPYISDDAQTFTTPAEFLRPESQPMNWRLIVLTADAPLQSTVPQQLFGNIQLLIYDGSSRRQVALKLLADLRSSLGTRVGPELTGQYRLLLDLMAALDTKDNFSQYQSRYYESLMRTPRHIFAPPQFFDQPG